MYHNTESPGFLRNLNPPGDARFEQPFAQALQQPSPLSTQQQQSSPSFNSGDYVSARKNSTASVASLGYQSVPHTPLNQRPPPPGEVYARHFGSISSVCTTDDEDFNENTHRWLPEHDALLSEQLRAYIDDPTTAPFSGRFPPSGVIQRVAKNTIKSATMQRVPFPHSAGAVRRRLLQLSALEAENVGPDAMPVDERGTVISNFNDGYFGSNMDLGPEAHAVLLESDRLAALDTASENALLGEPLTKIDTSNNPVVQGTTLDRPAARGRVPQLDLTMNDRPVSLEEDFNFDETPRAKQSWRQGVYPKDFSNIPLASPFKEAFLSPSGSGPMGSPADDADIEGFNDDVLNLVAKRKRDSLRMKRGARPT